MIRWRWSRARKSSRSARSATIRWDVCIRTARSTTSNYRGGRAFQNDWEKAERGPRAVDPSREYVDGVRGREPITEAQRNAVIRLNRVERELGADGSALVHDVLVHGLTMQQVGERRGLCTQRWKDYFARRFGECLDRLALFYGFATAGPAGNRRQP